MNKLEKQQLMAQMSKFVGDQHETPVNYTISPSHLSSIDKGAKSSAQATR